MTMYGYYEYDPACNYYDEAVEDEYFPPEWYDAELADFDLIATWEDAPVITAPALITTEIYRFSFDSPEAA